MTSLEIYRNAINCSSPQLSDEDMTVLDNENWYGPYKLFYFSATDPRPFVPSPWSFRYNSKNSTVNFATLEGNLWLLSILGLSVYPLIRKKYYDKETISFLDKKYRLDKKNWYGPYKNFYYCLDDTRSFVKNNSDVFYQKEQPLWKVILYKKKITLNFARLEAKSWLVLLLGLAVYPILRMKTYDSET